MVLKLSLSNYQLKRYPENFNLNITFVKFSELKSCILEKYYYKWFNDLKVRKFLDPLTPKYSSQIYKWIKSDIKNNYYLIRFHDETNTTPIGHVGIKPLSLTLGEVGIVIGEIDFWHKAIGTKSIAFIIGECIKRGYEQLEVTISENNYYSLKLFRNFGFV